MEGASPAPDHTIPAKSQSSRKNRLTPEDWVDAARATLVRSGVNAIKIDQLARDLEVSRGSFYWHFADHADLLKALLVSWVKQNTGPFLRVLERDRDRPLLQILHYCEVWLTSDEFQPAYDAAVRDWARTSDDVAKVVREADAERMDVLVQIFGVLGYDDKEALVRARTLYYHQIGYYALRVTQSLEERLKLFPTYFKVLTGCPIPPGYKISSSSKNSDN